MNLNKWLHDDLGLTNINEEQLNGLVYHPRHGALCRRLLLLLQKTTLSSRRHPGANVESELEEAKNCLSQELNRLNELKTQVRHMIAKDQHIEHEIWQLKERLQAQKELNEILRVTDGILERISNRPKVFRVLMQESLPSSMSGDDSILVPKSLCTVSELMEALESNQNYENLIDDDDDEDNDNDHVHDETKQFRNNEASIYSQVSLRSNLRAKITNDSPEPSSSDHGQETILKTRLEKLTNKINTINEVIQQLVKQINRIDQAKLTNNNLDDGFRLEKKDFGSLL